MSNDIVSDKQNDLGPRVTDEDIAYVIGWSDGINEGIWRVWRGIIIMATMAFIVYTLLRIFR